MSLIATFIVPHPPIVVPMIGGERQKEIQKTVDAFEEIGTKIAELKPDVIIVTSPHSVLYSDYFHISPGEHAQGDFKEFGAPNLKFAVDYDSDLAESISENAKTMGISAGTLGERNKNLDHGTMVPLYFINQYYQNYKLVRVSLSGLSSLIHYRFGKCIAQAAQQSEKRIILIASGDLSHKLKENGPYGLSKEGPIFDSELTKAISEGDFLRFMTFDEDFAEAAAECGLRSFIIMAGALDGKAVNPKLLSYEGPFGVGYAVASFNILGEDDSRYFDQIFELSEERQLEKTKETEDDFVKLARESLEHFVKSKQFIKRPNDISMELMNQKAGVFVSLKIGGKLRGCIGTISPTRDCIADEIIHNAVSASMEDPRFEAVRVNELAQLVYSVDVLGKAYPISSKDELDIKRYGVIVNSNGRRGLLLPNLEGVDTPEQQVSIALQKAGISSHEDYRMERFEVVRHK